MMRPNGMSPNTFHPMCLNTSFDSSRYCRAMESLLSLFARNPSRLQEMTRTMDRQMQNLEAMPGGMNILQRMYRDVQEPVLNAMGGPNPFQDLQGNAATPSQVPSTETSQPAPNPWASGQANSGEDSELPGSIYFNHNYKMLIVFSFQPHPLPRPPPRVPGLLWARRWARAEGCSPHQVNIGV